MNKNKLIVLIIGGLVIAAALFYGGMKYGRAHAAPAAGSFGRGGANFAGRPAAGGSRGGGLVAGQIISKDAETITIGLQAGGSRIVFLSTSTPVMKAAVGSLSDLQTGTNVVIMGSANPDGSLSAQSIQIRGATSTRTF